MRHLNQAKSFEQGNSFGQGQRSGEIFRKYSDGLACEKIIRSLRFPIRVANPNQQKETIIWQLIHSEGFKFLAGN
jgi:hypothetical protein